jgi:alginate O-acetyltransferase complex protein AlgI
VIQSTWFWVALALAALVYWRLPSPWRPAFLAVVSFGYLATLDPLSVGALAAWALLFFYAAPHMAEGTRRPRALVLTLIVAILGFLAFFKYFPPLLAAMGMGGLVVRAVIPLGISYYTFKLIHYAVEVARGNVPDRSLAQFLCYLFLFPIFTAGPIERFDHFLANQEPRWRAGDTLDGLTRIVHGLVKKLVVGDVVLAGLYGGAWGGETLVAQAASLTPGHLWASLAITYLYLYMDFSAYSDLAIGASRLFGIRIMENFHFPVVAHNIGDFWRRWHMTLSGWCQSYIYLPVIGLTRKPYLAAYASFTVLGLWHTAAPVRLLWALYHATGVLIFMGWTRLTRRGRWPVLRGRPARIAAVAVTQAFVVGSMAFLVAEGRGGAGTAFRLLARMIGVELG